MNKKNILAVISILGIAIGVLTVTKQAHTNATAKSRDAQEQSAMTLKNEQPEIPDYIVYRHLFRHVAAFKAKADELEQQGKNATHLRNFFKSKAILSDDQADTLDRIASQCARDIKALDKKAKPLIEAYKAQYPNGQVPHGQKPLPPPAELHALTLARNDLVLRSRDKLRAAFGEVEFKRFHEFVRSKVAPNVNPEVNPEANPEANPVSNER